MTAGDTAAESREGSVERNSYGVWGSESSIKRNHQSGAQSPELAALESWGRRRPGGVCCSRRSGSRFPEQYIRGQADYGHAGTS